MIVKIWPINADFSEQKGKTGGWQGVRNALNYIEEREKVTVPEEDLLDFGFQDNDTGRNSFINTEKDFHRVIDYVKNEDKTEAKYVSRYLCQCKDITKDFRLTAERIAYESRGKTKTNTGAMAFHIVQSFPPDLNISNEEVHQCGIELVQKLEKYQAVICSHVHPVVDEDGVVHGRAPHNHILINAFMYPDFYDPKKGGPRKYHACKDTYRQLQIYNDEIAIAHGLPIIRSTDQDRIYSWHESNEKNKGTSWKERVRADIEKYSRTVRNWQEFVNIMKREGYEISEKTYVTYTTPDGKKVRDANLGERFTKNSLELYWAVRNHNTERIKKELQANEDVLLSDYIYHFGEPLSVKIPLGNTDTGEKSHYFLPLNKDIKADGRALRSYVKDDQLYDICDEDGLSVIAASGLEIIQSIEDLRDEALMKFRADQWLYHEQARARRRHREEDEKEEQFYRNEKFKNSRTGNPYQTSIYDEDGRRRSTIELICVLALIILDKEEYLWIPQKIPHNGENEVFFASTDWKIQTMIDAIELARQEELEAPAQLDKRMDAVGADLSRAKSGIKKLSNVKERMDPIAETIAEYKEIRELAEGILKLPEGDEKEKMQARYANVMEKYQASKQILKRHRINNDDEIKDFDKRYKQIQTDIQEIEARKKELSEHYRRLKKLEHSLRLAEDPRYIYGPNYPGYEEIEKQRGR